MFCIGDVHGNFNEYKSIIQNCDESIQVGDLGIGFPTYIYESFPENHKFIRGNHDNPYVCREHRNYLGEFGIYKDIFFISGGFSIDRYNRIEGVDWWPDEELTFKQSYELLQLYEKTKPEIVVSHQCPDSIEKLLFDFYPNPCKTIQLLEGMLAIHKPEIWIFGHYHISKDSVIDGCRYVCLSELEVKEIA